MQQGMSLVKAISEMDPQPLFVWSSMAYVSEISRGKYTKVAQFDHKVSYRVPLLVVPLTR
jgi:hypothetical protein